MHNWFRGRRPPGRWWADGRAGHWRWLISIPRSFNCGFYRLSSRSKCLFSIKIFLFNSINLMFNSIIINKKEFVYVLLIGTSFVTFITFVMLINTRTFSTSFSWFFGMHVTVLTVPGQQTVLAPNSTVTLNFFLVTCLSFESCLGHFNLSSS